MSPVFSFQRGNTPLLISIPHAGVLVPQSISQRLTTRALKLQDTDWFVDRVYGWAAEQGAGLLVANYSRYVIDLNRPADDAALYTGAGTGLLPQTSFDGRDLYRKGQQPDCADVESRLEQFWVPYHEKLQNELMSLKHRFGHAVLLDAHSILSQVPNLFEGTLADLNLGSYAGRSAGPELVSASMAALESHKRYSLVLDGRFQGGYITRHYGDPDERIHALQLEMSQTAYMNEMPPVFNQESASQLIPVLQTLVDTLIQWKPADE